MASPLGYIPCLPAGAFLPGTPWPPGAEVYHFSSLGPAVIKRPLWDVTAQHLFQTHSLATKLKCIGCVASFFTPLILHWEWLIQSLLPVQGDPALRPPKLHHITSSAAPQLSGKDSHISGDEQIAPFFPETAVMRSFVKQLSIHRPPVFDPLVFQMDQRPLAAAEFEML